MTDCAGEKREATGAGCCCWPPDCEIGELIRNGNK